MTEFIAAVIVFGLVMLGMSAGLRLSGRQLKGSCGSLNNLKKLMGFNPCDACSARTSNCPLRDGPPTDHHG